MESQCHSQSRFLLFSILLFLFFASSELLARSYQTSYSLEYGVFSKDKSQLIYLRRKPVAEIIKVDTTSGAIIKKVPTVLSDKLIPFAATPDGFKLLAFTPTGISVIHNGSGKVLRTLPYPAKKTIYTHYVSAMSPKLFVQSDDGVLLSIPNPETREIDLIHTGTGKLLHSIDVSKHEQGATEPILMGVGFNKNRSLIAYLLKSKLNATTRLFVYDLYKKQAISNVIVENPHNTPDMLRFSQNNRFILLSSMNDVDVKLIDLENQSSKGLPFPHSGFAGFTADDTSVVIVQPRNNQVSLWAIQTGKVQTNSFGVEQYGLDIIQSADRSILALPYKVGDINGADHFLLIDARSGQVTRKRIGELKDADH